MSYYIRFFVSVSQDKFASAHVFQKQLQHLEYTEKVHWHGKTTEISDSRFNMLVFKIKNQASTDRRVTG